MGVYIRRVMIRIEKIMVVKKTMFHTKTFINTPGPLLMGSFTTRLITY
jgi:hypothetical protein